MPTMNLESYIYCRVTFKDIRGGYIYQHINVQLKILYLSENCINYSAVFKDSSGYI